MSEAVNLPIADLHCDTVIPIQRGYDISKRNEKHHIDIPRLQDGNVKLQVFACTSLHADNPGDHLYNVNHQLDLLNREIEKNSEHIEICLNTADIEQANLNGKIAAILAVEGGQALEDDPKNIDALYKNGVRLITLAHELSLDWCSYHKQDDAATRGLNELGREIVSEMNRLGMIIDISHSGDKTVEDVLSLSSAPIIASHSNARSICNHTRNLINDHIKGIAESGGLIGVTFVSNFISEKFDEAYEQFWSTVPKEKLKELLKLYTQEMPESEYQKALEKDFKFIIEGEKSYRKWRPSIEDVIDHLDYIANLVGTAHIGIGSDYDGISSTPVGLEDCSKLSTFQDKLLSRGYKQDQVKAILFDNFIRVFKSICG